MLSPLYERSSCADDFLNRSLQVLLLLQAESKVAYPSSGPHLFIGVGLSQCNRVSGTRCVKKGHVWAIPIADLHAENGPVEIQRAL